MAEQLSLDEVLVEKPPVEPTEIPPKDTISDNANIRHQQKEETAIKEGRARAEDGKFVKEVKKEEEKEVKEEKKEIPKQEFSDKERALLAAAQDERRKRQQLEQQIRELTAKKPPEKPFWEAPDEHFKAIEEQHKTWERGQQERETINLLKVSEMLSRREHPDFDQKVEFFGNMVATTPGLYQSWLQSPDPGEYAYNTAKIHMDLQEIGDPAKLREKIAKEERLKIEAELKDKEKKLRDEREALPGTLSDARGTKQQKTAWSGPTSLDDVLKG